MTDLNEMAAASFEVLQQREANGADVSSDRWGILKYMAGEVVEVADALHTYTFSGNLTNEMNLASEVADVIICAFNFAALMGLDIEAAVEKKMRLNENRARGIGDKL